jgi:type II secretory pathway pseudopilin PulG
VRRAQYGFTYLSLIILLAIIGLVGATALKVGSVAQRSRNEQQLLDIGAAFSDALQSYADATPAGLPPQPPSLKELLKDPRFPGTRRHLRKIFVDPMTGKAEWGIAYLGEKVGVAAVYSLSTAQPVKIGNFPARFMGFDNKQHISEWRFAATIKPAATAPAPAAAPGVPAPVPGKPLDPAAMPGATPGAPAPPATPAMPATPAPPENPTPPSPDRPTAPPAEPTEPTEPTEPKGEGAERPPAAPPQEEPATPPNRQG